MSDPATIFSILRDAAQRGEDLGIALERNAVPGSDRVRERLAAGACLPEALAGLVPERLMRLLAGGVPSLAMVCALLADAEVRRAERRRLLSQHLAYPMASLTVLALLALVVARIPTSPGYGHLVPFGLIAIPGVLALVIGLGPCFPRTWRVPGSGWLRHLDLGQRWSRAALAVDWRLTEAQAQTLLDVDLTACGAALGAPMAVEHCRQLAQWHLQAARRHLLLTAWISASLILLVGGAVVLGSARMWMTST